MEKPVVDTERLLEKFPGKGGWTFAAIPEIPQDRNAYFGWVTIRGYIDDYELSQVKLMPRGNGQLFLPVKAAIRKKIKKSVGDTVRIKLYLDNSAVLVPEDILACFEDEPAEVLQTFQSFTDNERKVYLDWIAAAKTPDTQADRIVKMLDRLKDGLKFYDK